MSTPSQAEVQKQQEAAAAEKAKEALFKPTNPNDKINLNKIPHHNDETELVQQTWKPKELISSVSYLVSYFRKERIKILQALKIIVKKK